MIQAGTTGWRLLRKIVDTQYSMYKKKLADDDLQRGKGSTRHLCWCTRTWASESLPAGLGKPVKDEEGHFKARRKALKGSKKPQKSVKKGSRGSFLLPERQKYSRMTYLNIRSRSEATSLFTDPQKPA